MKLSDLANQHGDQFIPVVEAELRRLATERPDFVYKNENVSGTCRYNGPAVDGDKVVGNECTGCIFGQALQNLGWDDPTELSRIIGIIQLIGDKTGISSPDRWQRVQASQDCGATWSNAVSHL